jgi:type IV secretory pathway component VirB8
MQVAGSYTPDYNPLTLVGCQGIAARDTSANNLAGTATFAAATTVAVTLPIAETNANYLIFFDNPANQTLWVTSKTASGFTINSSVSNSTTVGWLLIRHL